MRWGTELKRNFRISGRVERRRIDRERRKAKKRKEHVVELRLRAIWEAGVEGRKQAEVADRCGVPLRTVEEWIKRYRREGCRGMRNRPIPGKPPRLTEKQRGKLKEAVLKGPEANGFDSGVWTAPMLVEWIWKKFHVRYSASQVRRILHALGFSVQYPRQVLSKANLKEQRRWMREEWPRIKKKRSGPVGS